MPDQTPNIQGSMAGSAGLGGQVAGTVLGMMTAGYNDKRQRKMNAELIKQQELSGMRMADYEQQLAYDMWEKTNYSAQRDQLRKAGLNVALMYGKGGGAGGSTQGAGDVKMPGSSTAPVGGGEIGMGMQMGMQAQMMSAQIELMRAQANKTNIEANKIGGVDTGVGLSTIKKLEQDAKTGAMQEILTKWQGEIAHIEQQVKSETIADEQEAIRNANDITEQQARLIRTQADVAEDTKESLITQLNMAKEEQVLRIMAQKKGLIKTDAEIAQIEQGITKMRTEINTMIQGNMREWDKLSNEQKRTRIEEKIMEIAKQNADFNTSTPQQVRQWTDLAMSILTLGLGAQGGGGSPAGFKFK